MNIREQLIHKILEWDSLHRLIHKLNKQGEQNMATIQDLQASVAALQAASTNAKALIVTLEAKVASLEATTVLVPADQASLDASVAAVDAVAKDLVAAVPAPVVPAA